MSDKLVININDLTLGQLEQFEELAGLPLSQALDQMGARVMLALVTVVKQGDDPDWTMDDTRKMKFAEIDRFELGGDEDPS